MSLYGAGSWVYGQPRPARRSAGEPLGRTVTGVQEADHQGVVVFIADVAVIGAPDGGQADHVGGEPVVSSGQLLAGGAIRGQSLSWARVRGRSPGRRGRQLPTRRADTPKHRPGSSRCFPFRYGSCGRCMRLRLQCWPERTAEQFGCLTDSYHRVAGLVPLPFVLIVIISYEADRLLFLACREHPLKSSGEIRTALPR